VHNLQSSRSRARRRGFTLIEVLATLMLMAIAMPAIVHGIALAQKAASASRHRSEAAVLAASKLNELVWTGNYQTETSGDFGTDWPMYTWTAETSDWTPTAVGNNVIPQFYQQIEELDVTVKWGELDGQSYTLTTLVYPNSATSQLAIQNAAAAAASSTTGTTQ
jgi:general secretion pathway protein I